MTSVEYILTGSLGDAAPVILRRDTDEARIQPKPRTIAAWDLLTIQRVVHTTTAHTIKAWKGGREATDEV